MVEDVIIGDATLMTGDCAIRISDVEFSTVDLTLTSPPYHELRSYKGFSFDFERIAKELYRVTKAGGVVVLDCWG